MSDKLGNLIVGFLMMQLKIWDLSKQIFPNVPALSPLHSGVVITNEPVREKTNNFGFDQVRHKPGCTVTEDG